MNNLKLTCLYLKNTQIKTEIRNPGINLGCIEEASPAKKHANNRFRECFNSLVPRKSRKKKATKRIKQEAQIDSYPIEMEDNAKVGFSEIK